MFPITLTINNQFELNAIMVALGASKPNTGREAIHAAVQAPQEATEKKPKTQASTSAKTPDAHASTQPTVSAPAVAASSSGAGNSDAAQSGSDEGAWNTQDGYKDSAEYQTVAKAVVDLARTKGREAAAALLEKIAGVKSLPESKPSQADAIVAAFKAGV
ncbi:MAG: hypothetical protein EPN31_06175 [Castellaniella sp.]|uniref:hypothetical protein n=1 Tax=Castellaniella sp. TaxID=1955812 RepID=UPI0012087B1F|nr:hypothetical protein [Castellaniella sp.]TAN29569.1 MAG: hypothetical protein EPN31_06175 [Castellaniella sp.]